MSVIMSAALPWLLLVITVAAMLRFHRQVSMQTPRRWPRLALLLVLQGVCSVLLYHTLVPPLHEGEGGQLVVLGSGASRVQWHAVPAARVIALPEARAGSEVEQAPDLATALRRHPDTRMLQLVGDGLVARDRDVPLPAQVMLQAPTLRPGWIALQVPTPAAPGALFDVHAQARGGRDTQAELRDPAGQVVASARLDAQGRVVMQGVARSSGHSLFQLRLLDARQHLLDAVPVPVQTLQSRPLNVQLLAAAPSPEAKYLRRWAADAGMAVQASANTGAGVVVGDGNPLLNAERLAALDLLVLDERSLQGLTASQRSLLRQALREGLGVLVRGSGPLLASQRSALQALGLSLSGSNAMTPLQLQPDADAALLQARRGPARADEDTTPAMQQAMADSRAAALPSLQRVGWQVDDAHPLLHAQDGSAVGGWRNVGHGRIGYLPVPDTWLLTLAGRDDRHAELWSLLAGTLARARPAQTRIALDALPWAGERTELCGVAAATQVRAADAAAADGLPLVVDPTSADRHCAGWWPRQAGWHQLLHDDGVQDVYVFDPAEATVLHRQHLREAALRRVASSMGTVAATPVRVPGPRWPWLLAFVLAAGLMWWLERWRPRVR